MRRDEEEEHLFRENLAYFETPETREAYLTLRKGAEKYGLRWSILGTAAARPFRLYGTVDRKELYLFSADRALAHFRFHVRKPALGHLNGIQYAATACLENPVFTGDQIISEITTVRQANAIVDRLFKRGGWKQSTGSVE